MEKQLQFKFKGSRNYVHGTDIFKFTSQALQERSIGWIKQLRFNCLLNSNAKLLIGDDLVNYDKDNFSAIGSIVADGEKDLQFALLQRRVPLIYIVYVSTSKTVSLKVDL